MKTLNSKMDETAEKKTRKQIKCDGIHEWKIESCENHNNVNIQLSFQLKYMYYPPLCT